MSTKPIPLLDLAKTLKSFLDQGQINELVSLLADSVVPKATVISPNIEEILNEMEEAYSITKFAPLQAEEARRVRDSFPNFIERCSANQGRHLVAILRDRIKGDADGNGKVKRDN